MAMQHLHANGVVHNDLKLSNLMLDEVSQRVVLIDFGTALQRGASWNDMDDQFRVTVRAGAPVPVGGNMAQKAPEVIAALNQHRSLPAKSEDTVDIPLGGQGAFATGVVLWRLAMGGTHPLPDYPPSDIHTAVLQLDPDRVAQLASVAGETYAAVTTQLLAFQPEKRLTLADAVGLLQEVVRGQQQVRACL